MEKRRFGALSSITDPESLSATVSGAILMFSGLIVLAGHLLGFSIADGQIGQFAQQAGTSVGFLWMCFGLVRKIVVSIQQKFSNS